MAICKSAIERLHSLLGPEEAREVYRLAKKVETLETLWRINLERFFERITDAVVESLTNTGKLPEPDFEKFFADHAFSVAIEALRDSRPVTVKGKKLAGPPKGVVPKSLSDLMRQWDKYRKTGKAPARQREIAKKVKREYLNRVQSFWKTQSEDFRTGDVTKVYDQKKIREALQEESRASYARSKMIVETETTYYYNQVRRKYYDASDDVTHYLFMAIRDHRTTAWCKTRHEIVYAKGDPITDKETPPCFLGFTPVLTKRGWMRIAEIKVGDYVWTHANRWRRVKAVYSTKKRVRLFQAGFAVGTANHPYASRDHQFIQLSEFRPEEGVRTGPSYLPALRKAEMGSVVQSGQKNVRDTLQYKNDRREQFRIESSELERWSKDFETWLRRYSKAASSESKQARLRARAHLRHGKILEPESWEERSCASPKRQQKGQPDRKSSSDVRVRSYKITPLTGRDNTTEVVYNLEVAQDHTYHAGGFLVHNCHWNCRSEMLPLTPINPVHRKLIDDTSRARRQNSPEPLPKGWGKR